VRNDNERIEALLPHRHENGLEFSGLSYLQRSKRDAQLPGRALCCFETLRPGGIPEGSTAGEPRENFLQELHALSFQLWRTDGQPCNVCARPRETGNESKRNRIGGPHKDDGDHCRGTLCYCGRWTSARQQDVDIQSDQLVGERCELIWITPR